MAIQRQNFVFKTYYCKVTMNIIKDLGDTHDGRVNGAENTGWAQWTGGDKASFKKMIC